ncbi:MAG: hypothetical protein ABSH40_05755 [Bryobacteraceae bacterium]|jgi:hypothetical protein
MHTGPTDRSVPTAARRGRAAIAALMGSKWVFALLSLLFLIPCYWQPRIQAGDLSSHIYNSWLSQMIESGRLQGLVMVQQTTNILFDLILSGLFKVVGPEAAQRIAVSLAVLTFVWGAFAFIGAVAGRRPWHLLPSIAMLAYGWVYHMGFFNFYLSLGLCFWGLSVVWDWSGRRMAMAAPIFVVAYVAHALPVVWAACLVGYLLIARNLSPRLRVYLVAASLIAMVLLHAVIGRTMVTQWSLQQIDLSTGVDQVWVFDSKYYVVMVGLVVVWGLLFLNVIHLSGARQVVSGIPFQLCTISAAGVFILPTAVLLPGFQHSLAFIAERMSLGVGVCVCALLGAARPKRLEMYALALVTMVFFGFLYRDERALNSFEDRMQDTVAKLAPGRRVISAVQDSGLRVNALAHMIDRVCIGHCYSYANYEPSTAQFRIRAKARNPYVAYSYEQSWELQMGVYVVRESDLPLYQVDLDENGKMVVKELRAGMPCGSTEWDPLSETLPAG